MNTIDNGITRGAGILCHISSLNGKYGIGTLGKEAYEFADFLKKCHVKYWQILPLVQTGYGDSPYQSVCCNSGNPYFIDLKALRDDGLLSDEELIGCEVPLGSVDYAELYNSCYRVLRLAFTRFNVDDNDFIKFINSGEYDDYALFMSLKSCYGGTFSCFPQEYKFREQSAIKKFRKEHKNEYLFWLFLQYVFKKQWTSLKNYVNSLGIKIIGDIPLYVAYDSSDVWCNPQLFKLDEELHPTDVAGVPPDYFSKTGQLWGNPLYDWELMAKDNFKWWVNRVKRAAELYNVVRIDHFRGLDRYYAINSGSSTAETGRWLEGPKEKLFDCIKAELGNIPIIAEDLGVIDDGVIRLRHNMGFPGMKILQFAFDGNPSNAYLPAHIRQNSVVYTGTHDNNTALGFLEEMTEEQFNTLKARLRAALKTEGVVYSFETKVQTARALCVCALASNANLAIIPVQDLLALGDSARMNTPSVAQGNWQFRLAQTPSQYYAAIMRKMVSEFNR